MKNKVFRNYYLLSLLGVLIASCYPLYMGAAVITDMIRYGTVYAESYPKYIIPYTPISLAIIVGVALIPLMMKCAKKLALLLGSAIAVVVFFVSELLLESQVIVTETVTTTLESWQMFMCYIPPEGYPTRTWTEVDVLMGDYSPAFKMHFYIISIVLIISFLNCFYGFAKVIHTGNKNRLKPLVMQSIASVSFLAMCIWACFTAFYRTGDIQVSALSAVLMSVFFVLFGITMGIYVLSFTLNRRKLLSVVIPSITASVITFVMYLGEMFLLSGHLYRFGTGFFFESIGGIALAPIDIVIILMAGVITALIADRMTKSRATIPRNISCKNDAQEG